MDYTYDIVTAKSDKTATLGLHLCHTINTVVEIFVSTFLIGYIYTFSNGIYDYILKAGIYEIISYFVMFITYYVSSIIVNKTNRVSVYRASTVIWAIFLVFAVFYGEQIAKLLWLAGFLCGFSRGVYWSSFNVLRQEMVGKSNMTKFSTFSMVLQKSTSVIFPLTLGALIDISTYSTVAIIILIFCLLQIACSFLIKSKHPAGSDFDVFGFIKRLREKNELTARLKFLYGWAFVYGANTAVTTIMNIAIMLQFGSSGSLGAITSAMAVAVIITTILVGKFSKEGKRTPLYAACIAAIFLSVALYIVAPAKSTFIIMDVFLSIAGIVFKLIYEIYRNKFLKEYGRYNDINEHQCLIESIFQVSRTASYMILLLVGLTKSMILLNAVFALLLLLFAANLMFAIIFEKKFSKQENIEKAV